MSSELNTLAQKVEAVLKKYPDTRDDDRHLIQTLLGVYYGVDYFTPFGAVLKNRNLPSFESIRRARQRIQEHDESLRGSKESEKVRLAKQAEYIEFAREDLRI